MVAEMEVSELRKFLVEAEEVVQGCLESLRLFSAAAVAEELIS